MREVPIRSANCLQELSSSVGMGEAKGFSNLPGHRAPRVSLNGPGQPPPVGKGAALDSGKYPFERPGLHWIVGGTP